MLALSPVRLRISASVGEQRYQAWAYDNFPLRKWVNIHCYKFEQVRTEAWRTPLPPPEHFE